MSAGLVVRWRGQTERRLSEKGSREEGIRGGPILHLEVFDMCLMGKEGDLGEMASMAELKGGLGVWKTWRVDMRWRKEKWHDSPCAIACPNDVAKAWRARERERGCLASGPS